VSGMWNLSDSSTGKRATEMWTCGGHYTTTMCNWWDRFR